MRHPVIPTRMCFLSANIRRSSTLLQCEMGWRWRGRCSPSSKTSHLSSGRCGVDSRQCMTLSIHKSKICYQGGNLYGLYFGYVKVWWPYRNDPNGLLLHYADMVKDTGALVSKLAQFLEVDLSESEKEKVVEKCSLPHMKQFAHQFDHKLVLAPSSGVESAMRPSTFVGQGKAGAGARPRVSPEVAELWEDAIASEFEDADLRRFASEGGEWTN
ncbi:unnamed protein product [Polarella glacialis]|uniref:Sulfotransferase domain-containing protein n=1 Tax=Polarella glacialis TaxID=89957 RepID=A0A813FS14_POLGL|nr:unnamed protein product [Polarella glacialis]CAE8709344.1 unnamed protein product [Polarella glacialis]